MTKRNGDWMQTFTGRQFWPIDSRAEEICIEDIAHALSIQCRYAGHCEEFYSVAQHSVIVSVICAPEDALWGLLHDAAEAYLVDLPRPIKRHSELGACYRPLEEELMAAICKCFSLPLVEPASVKKADNVAIVTEMRDLMMHPPARWKESWDNEPSPWVIYPWPPKKAEQKFLQRFEYLSIRRGRAHSV